MMIETAGVGDPAYTQTMPREPQSAGIARHLTASALHVWGLEAVQDAAAAVVTELVSNTVRHAERATIRVTVTKAEDGRRVRIAVVDFCPTFPQPRDVGPEECAGRGLSIVAAMCDGRWGTDRLRWGKRVWAELAVPEEKPDE
ncbi:ATP-binding protein [Streptomyces sp. NBC_01207]|uniref:ATP-binding protein n=1 Tax=Streptomyces sp. NBC_01207 TaxID=2903772 RepID=UPI002E0D3801|nr:ATP-binding protein [Streptomyces sp. NBC_01207]